jgi:hypothetical protein
VAPTPHTQKVCGAVRPTGKGPGRRTGPRR